MLFDIEFHRFVSNFIEFGISVIEFGTLCASRTDTAAHLRVEASYSWVAHHAPETGLDRGRVLADQTTLRPERLNLAKRRMAGESPLAGR